MKLVPTEKFKCRFCDSERTRFSRSTKQSIKDEFDEIVLRKDAVFCSRVCYRKYENIHKIGYYKGYCTARKKYKK